MLALQLWYILVYENYVSIDEIESTHVRMSIKDYLGHSNDIYLSLKTRTLLVTILHVRE